MPRLLVVFGTTDGHTKKVADAIRECLLLKGHETDVVDAARNDPDPRHYDGVVVAASVHAGRYQRDITRWVSKHAVVLNVRPTAFVSVCLAVLQHQPAVDQELEAIIRRFLASTLWQPVETQVVAGALKYTQYNVLKRWIMKRIVKRAGGDTDTTRDYEYTDWEDLRRFVDRFSRRLAPRVVARAS